MDYSYIIMMEAKNNQETVPWVFDKNKCPIRVGLKTVRTGDILYSEKSISFCFACMLGNLRLLRNPITAPFSLYHIIQYMYRDRTKTKFSSSWTKPFMVVI